MIETTETKDMMGIAAYDRDPVIPNGKNNQNIVLLGDSFHPMSPFKGQGANQALLDSVHFCEILNCSSSISSSVLLFESQMVSRVKNKVLQSRERVSSFHNKDILNQESFSFRFPKLFDSLLSNLKSNSINSDSGDDIENLIIQQMKLLDLI